MKIEDVAAKIDPNEARTAVARVMVALGSQSSWNADTLDEVANAVLGLAARAGLPSISDQDDAAVEFWQAIP